MGFPTPPPLKEKPLRPEGGALALKRPNRVWIVLCASMAFWTLIFCAIVGIIVLLASPWLSRIPHQQVVIGVLFAIAVWYGVSMGWRTGSAVIIVAMRDTPKT